MKATRTQAFECPDLLVPPHPEPEADLYFLTHWFDPYRVRIIGYAARSMVVEREYRISRDIKRFLAHPKDDFSHAPRLFASDSLRLVSSMKTHPNENINFRDPIDPVRGQTMLGFNRAV